MDGGREQVHPDEGQIRWRVSWFFHQMHHVARIVEHRDATDDELAIREWNAGVYVVRRDLLDDALARTNTDNAQGEYYLTDVIAVLAAQGHRVAAVYAAADEVAGVNDPDQLAAAEAAMIQRTTP